MEFTHIVCFILFIFLIITLLTRNNQLKESFTCQSNKCQRSDTLLTALTKTPDQLHQTDEDAINYLKDLFRHEIKPTLSEFL